MERFADAGHLCSCVYHTPSLLNAELVDHARSLDLFITCACALLTLIMMAWKFTNKNIYELLSSKSLLLEGGEYSGRHGVCYILLSPETSDGLGLGVETHSLHEWARKGGVIRKSIKLPPASHKSSCLL